ncbi:nucleoid-associated protein [Pseudoalteromonas sp. 1_2015MBL_MicDiv]|uniref:nucleoid-associated protein n=1 Tax=Pseudoalteromonas sp. 1_2015MBL_MicDiv TaxID=1720343 RepID=UPI000BBE85C4|nr:nucleoid-associated protein [Pseudoalteromonas sp. 1_2015MBL_MicDiv]ATG76814.1 nucleoid-associated protein [Pseudoalteromonas sp. 1_2015MBL_MicDiv]
MAVIQRFVIHELFKDKKPDIATDLLDLDNSIILDLATQLIKIKENRTAVLWGQFKENRDFPKGLIDLNNEVDESKRSNLFLSLTNATMQSLHKEINHTNSKGGYICFIEYGSYNDTRFMAAMIKNTAGIKLTNLKPTKEIHVDLSKLHQAVDVNTSGYLKSLNGNYEKNYLSFIGKGKDTDYFANAFGCIDRITPARAVNKAPIVLRDFLTQFKVDNSSLKNARAQLVKYLSDNIDKEVHLSKIEEIAVSYLPDTCSQEEKESFLAFSKQEKYEMPATFQARKDNVNKLANIYYSTEVFNFNFNQDKIGLVGSSSDSNKPILFNKETNDVIIKGEMITLEVKEAIYQATLLNNNKIDINERS